MATCPSFEELIDKHSAEIYAYLWRMMGSPEDAQDSLQDAFLRAYKAYPRLVSRPVTAQTNYRAWLYKIAANAARTHLKRRSRANSRTLDLRDTIAANDPAVPDQVQARLSLQEVRRAVDGLPHKQRSALLMRKYQGLAYEEIAEALDCSLDSARAHVYQALKKLRAQFTPSETVQEES
jgi:RNA polymerase sigma-70 factor (ECF subfamily)